MLRKLIQNIVTPALLATLPLAGVAEPIIFSSGIKGGGYWSAAKRLQGVAVDIDLEVQVEESPGSLHNLARLLDERDPVSLVLSQADALQHHLNENPGLAAKVEILENIGQECVFILTGSNSAITTAEDLQKNKGYKLAISSPDSGVAVTYNYMTTLAPELAGTSILYTNTAKAMTGLNAKNGGAANAVMLVHRPKEYSTEVDQALRKPEQFRFVKVSDSRFDSELPNGEPVYKAMKLAIPVPQSDERREVTTICVKGLLVANKDKLSRDQRGKLGNLTNTRWMEVYATKR